MRRAVVIVTLFIAAPALAQQLPSKPADPLIEEVGKSLSPEGIRERQLLAIKALADAYEAEKVARAAEQAWWASYIKGLYK